MKLFVQSLLAGWIALQALACASADPSAEQNDETTPAAFEVALEDGAIAQANELESEEAPQAIELLSPDERDAALDEVTGPRGWNLADLVLQARLLETGLDNVQVIDPPREEGRE